MSAYAPGPWDAIPDDALITVCDKCLQATCWQGKFMCDESRDAGTVQKTARELRALGYEHPDHWLSDPDVKAAIASKNES